MLIEQIFELGRPRPHGRICTPITGCFHYKTIIFKGNIRLDCYLQLKYCRRQCTLLTPSWTKSLTKFTPNARFLTWFGLKLQAKGGLNNLIFSNGFQMLKI